MEDPKIKKFIATLKKRIPLFVFLAIATIAFFLASTLLLDDSYKDIILIAMVWSLPLFIH
ncbi:MAG: hypothetical protein IJ734_06265 [Fibrobacter sp.]|nr:hypothetical protein [Fibrobacter sp.]